MLCLNVEFSDISSIMHMIREIWKRFFVCVNFRAFIFSSSVGIFCPNVQMQVHAKTGPVNNGATLLFKDGSYPINCTFF